MDLMSAEAEPAIQGAQEKTPRTAGGSTSPEIWSKRRWRDKRTELQFQWSEFTTRPWHAGKGKKMQQNIQQHSTITGQIPDNYIGINSFKQIHVQLKKEKLWLKSKYTTPKSRTVVDIQRQQKTTVALSYLQNKNMFYFFQSKTYYTHMSPPKSTIHWTGIVEIKWWPQATTYSANFSWLAQWAALIPVNLCTHATNHVVVFSPPSNNKRVHRPHFWTCSKTINSVDSLLPFTAYWAAKSDNWFANACKCHMSIPDVKIGARWAAHIMIFDIERLVLQTCH